MVVLALLVYLCMRSGKKAEKFANIGGLDNVGSLQDDQYSPVLAPDSITPAQHFADMVDTGDFVGQPKSTLENIKPMERLHRVQGKSLMPRTSRNVTPYNIDVADPVSHRYMANTPRVTTGIKSRFKDYSLSSFTRGDIPIKYHPNVPYISKTIQGRDDLRLDGLFTPHFQALYSKYTGRGFKNMPVHVAGAGVAGGGVAGAAGGVIMDSA